MRNWTLGGLCWLLLGAACWAQDKASLKPLEGAWKSGDGQVQVRVESDQIQVRLNLKGLRQELVAPYQQLPNQASSGSGHLGRIQSFDQTDQNLHLSIHSENPGMSGLGSNTGVLESVHYSLSLSNPDDPGKATLRLRVSERWREGSASRSSSKSYSLKR